jgi:hypothetical protein
MGKRERLACVLVVIGLIAMLAGAIDPLEGSLVILPGSVMGTVGAMLARTRYKKLIVWSFALVVIGIGALWGLSAVGGFGGTSGRTNWWALILAPYPVGWVMGIVGGILKLREARRASAKPDAQLVPDTQLARPADGRR